MIALLVTGAVTFYLIPNRPVVCAGLIVMLLVVLRLAGPQVMERFGTAFASSDARDASAESRIVLWSACIDSMLQNPIGVGPANWGEVVPRYGFKRGKLAHTLWLQLGAELGVIGLGLIGLFYGLCIVRLWPLTFEATVVPDPWFRHLARMVIASLIGFIISAQFVSLDLLEHPYYVTLIGAGLLKLYSCGQMQSAAHLVPPSGFRGPGMARRALPRPFSV